jgi:3-hydroxyisobutyrate dehydrogenase-like beta-hydroxyacid dehydrogenase
MKISFLGLGAMGTPIALNLLKSGEELTAYDVNTTKLETFRSRGIGVAESLIDAARGEIIFLSLPNTRVVESVFFAEDGLLGFLRSGQTVVDLSTIDYTATIKLADALAEIGVGFLDAPVSGMEARAVDGTLTVMCGGEFSLFQKIEPLLRYFSNKIFFMGRHGSGQLTKLINQLLFDINAAAIAEILPLAAKMGLDPEKVGEVVNSGTGRSFASEFFIPRTLEDIFTDGYPMKHAYKDLINAAELGMSKGIPLPVLFSAATTYQMALLKGYGDCGKGAMIRVFEELLEVKFRKGTGAQQ